MPDAGRAPLDADAVVLAGGSSSRMGSDKALLVVDGKTLLARKLEELGRIFRRVSVSVAGAGFPAIVARQIPDGTPNLGPLEGVRASLQALGAPALFAAVDLGGVSGELARALWAEGTRPGRRGAVPRWRGGLEPAFAVYAPALLPDLVRLLESGRRDLRQLAALAGVAALDLEDPRARAAVFGGEPPDFDRLFLNLNRPEDLQAWQPPPAHI